MILTIRRIRYDDLDGLAALYESLSAEDRYRRFFSPLVVPRHTLEGWVSLAPPDGVGLVAEVTHRDERRELVGHADFHLLPDGNAELAITVAQPWRGGVGGRLLDGLRDEAAALGIANLEAELLVTNRPMHTLLAHRGAVTTARPEFSFERLIVSTTGGVPSWWPDAAHPRLLIEHPGWPGIAKLLAAEGWTVVACPGPASRPGCPALAGKVCPLAAGADAIALLLPEAAGEELRLAHATLHAAPTLVADPGGTSAIAVALRGCAAHAQTGAGPRPDCSG